MSNYFRQYFRDSKKLLSSKNRKDKLRLFYEYNRMCFKNLLYTKIFNIKTTKDTALGYTFYYENFNSFFAMFTEIFIHNIYGELELGKGKKVIVDAGSNIGVATIFFKYKYPDAVIYSIEPDEACFDLLRKNCEMNNLSDVILLNKALSNYNGKVKLYSFPEFKGSAGNTIFKDYVRFKDAKETLIPCITLSSLNIPFIDLLKIDVEGAEGNIIEDLYDSCVLGDVGSVILEYHYGVEQGNSLSGILSALEDFGFDYVINPDSLIDDNIDLKVFRERWAYVLIINCIKKEFVEGKR